MWCNNPMVLIEMIQVPLLPSWIRWTGVIVVGSAIFYLSIITAPPPEPIIPAPPDLIPLDKWRHFIAYGTLAVSLWYATFDWEEEAWMVGMLVIGLTVLYGVGLEFWQSMIPERYFSVGDAYSNALGSLFAVPLLIIRGHLDSLNIWKSSLNH